MERYFYRIPQWNGEFRNIGTGWEEYQNLVRVVAFIEESRSFDSITLYDTIRDLRVLLPIGGGQSFFRIGSANWSALYPVDRMQQTFTQANITALQQDCQAARTRLDTTIGRLGESVIVPTASFAAMRAAVLQIFHINHNVPNRRLE